MQYTITNIVPNFQEDIMLVFYAFSNGDTQSNRFPLSTSMADMQKWGVDKCAWYDDRAIMLEAYQKQIDDDKAAADALQSQLEAQAFLDSLNQ
jgi:hypothetical protein